MDIKYPDKVLLPTGGELVLIEIVHESVTNSWGGSLTKTRRYAKYFYRPLHDTAIKEGDK